MSEFNKPDFGEQAAPDPADTEAHSEQITTARNNVLHALGLIPGEQTAGTPAETAPIVAPPLMPVEQLPQTPAEAPTDEGHINYQDALAGVHALYDETDQRNQDAA